MSKSKKFVRNAAVVIALAGMAWIGGVALYALLVGGAEFWMTWWAWSLVMFTPNWIMFINDKMSGKTDGREET
jgi:hypothetical protein